jgi:diacylglycerol kinase (ATP)
VAMTIVANPASGRGRVRRLLPEVMSALSGVGIDARVVLTQDATDLRTAVRRERESGADRVIVCGGDGSLHLAAQELAGGDTALGIVPAGTGDDNARTLGIPRGDPGAAARLAATGVATRMDLGRVVTGQGDQRVFLGVMSAGFDSLVNERANRMSWPSGNARYLVAILGELRTFRPVPYRALIDGRALEGEAMLVAVGNGACYGGGMRVCPDAVPDDGYLDVTWLHGVRTSTFVRVFPQVFSGGHVRSPYVSTVRASVIELDAPGQLAYADGEPIGPLPVDVAVLRGALPVIRGDASA